MSLIKATLRGAFGEESSDLGTLKSGHGRGSCEVRRGGIGQVVVVELTGDAVRGSAGSCSGKLEWKAVAMLATNSEMGTEEVSCYRPHAIDHP